LYSGTVAAAIEGAFFGITSVAVSLEYDEHAAHDKAARLARLVIQQILAQKGAEPQLYNVNIPTSALHGPAEVRVVPMSVLRYGERFIERQDPKGRTYYWAMPEVESPPPGADTDLSALERGFVTLTPLQYDMTARRAMAAMATWQFRLPSQSESGE
ncbi:MAG: 5'/3'-nucleotidase SurE, partial [Planctomycetes bacterium]|nr:5'/3'-nucleotidase SurE [Planctomycetota bacterium]